MFKPLTLSLIFSLSALGSLTSAHAGDPVADTVLVSYGNVSPAPVIVRGSLVEGKDGSLYGVSQNGGLTGGYGTVFRVPPGGGGLTLLHSFGGPDGNDPEHALAIDAKGVLYGTTYGGGAGSPACGTVFSLTPAGVFKTLHTFRCDDSGGAVDSNVVFGADGFLYGTTNYGPTRDGLVFRIARNGSQFSVVANFNTTGSGEAFGTPVGGLMPGQDGSFYGMALYYRGPDNQRGSGAIYRYTPGGGISLVYGFAYGSMNPPSVAPPARDAAGNLYLYGSQTATMVPVVYRLATNGVLSVLHSFDALSFGQVGWCTGYGSGSILLHSDGRLYGEAPCGGTAGMGFDFSLSTDGSDLQVLHNFANDGVDVQQPSLGLIANRLGGLSSQTGFGGGAPGAGGVYKLLGPTVAMRVKPAKIALGQTATLTWSSTETAECAASGDWGPGAEPLAGSAKVTPAAAGIYTFTLACNGAGTATRSVKLTVQ